MNLFRKFQLRFRAFFQKRSLDAEMDEELRSHIELRTQQNIENGMSPDEARCAALRQFGWMDSLREACREQRGVTWLEHLLQDVRYGARILRKNPGFTTVAVLTLALGIGANTAIFSVVNGVLLHPLPYADSERLVKLYESNPQAGWPKFPIACPNFLDWRKQVRTFEDLAAYTSEDYNLTGRDIPERLLGGRVSASLFTVLGVQPLLGRTFAEDEDQYGKNHVVILSHATWDRMFGRDASILGKTLTLSGSSYAIIGVMPAGFGFPNPDTQIWIPIAFTPGELDNRGAHTVSAIGRLRPGVTPEQAQPELRTLARNLEQQFPETNKGWTITFVPLLEESVGSIRRALLVLFGAVGFVLLIACTNVANLLLARTAARKKEFALRAALGAARNRVVRQLITESVLLAGIGSLLGTGLAYAAIRGLILLKPANVPRLGEVQIDLVALGFTILVGLTTGLVFGLGPAFSAAKTDLTETLKEGGRGSTAGTGSGRLRNSLLISEMALSLVLLIGAGLMVRSFAALRQVNPGFNPDGVLAADLNLPQTKYATQLEQIRFVERLLQALDTAPGIVSAATVFGVPMSRMDATISLSVEGRPPPRPGEEHSAGYRQVSQKYFETLRTPLIRGRGFTERDSTNSQPVVIVSETFATKFFPGEDPIGKRIRVGDGGRNPCEIVGIVRDVKRESLEATMDSEMYFPMLQRCWGYIQIVARSAGPPLTIANTIRSAIWSIDKDQPIYNIRPLGQLVANSVGQRRFAMLLLTLFSAVAVLLAAIGMYGVMSYLVAQRSHEIGIRVALGAQRRDVLGLVIGRGMKLAGVGLVFGLLAALAVTQAMQSLLYEIKPTDPLTFLAVVLLLVTIACLACWLPARRAAKVDPMAALRYE